MTISEVTRLRRTIQEEYEAAHRALHASAMTGKHAFITKRMENMQKAHAQLQTILGDEEAIKLVASILESVQEARIF